MTESQTDFAAKREISTIQFPYNDLNDAIEVAQGVHRSGGSRAELDALAATLGHDSTSSGAFKLKLTTARIFGLISNERGAATLTTLGREIIDPNVEKSARARSFLHVPLYRTLYEKNRGTLLPPDRGLEAEMASLGVAKKQTDKARQAFQRSAEQAGFFAHGRDRLIAPANIDPSEPAQREQLSETEPSRKRNGSVETGDVLHTVHPLIAGLLKTIPAGGQPWPSAKRKDWLTTAAYAFKLLYGQDDEDPIDADALTK